MADLRAPVARLRIFRVQNQLNAGAWAEPLRDTGGILRQSVLSMYTPSSFASRLSLLLLVVFALPCHAGKLYECRDAAGRVSFVDHGCGSASLRREITVVAGPANAKAVAENDARQIEAWTKASRGRLPASLGGSARTTKIRTSTTKSTASKAADGCSAARAAEDRAHREQSFTLGFDGRRKLSDAVLAACGLR